MELIISEKIRELIKIVEGPNYLDGECYGITLFANELDSISYTYIDDEWMLEYVINGDTKDINTVNELSANKLIKEYNDKFDTSVYQLVCLIEGNLNTYYNIVSNIDDLIFVDDNKIKLIACLDSDERKLLHTYFQDNYSNIGKASLRSDVFEEGNSHISFDTCDNCDYIYVYMNYREGSLDSGEDSYYYGTCNKCKNEIMYDPFFNLYQSYGYHELPGNNVFAWGNYFHGYKRNKHNFDVNDQDIRKIFNKYKIYEIDAPTKPIKKGKIGYYIQEQING